MYVLSLWLRSLRHNDTVCTSNDVRVFVPFIVAPGCSSLGRDILGVQQGSHIRINDAPLIKAVGNTDLLSIVPYDTSTTSKLATAVCNVLI